MEPNPGRIARRGLLAAALMAPAAAAWGKAPRRRPTDPRNLEGAWTLATYTPLERPKTLKTLVLTPAEGEAYEAPLRRYHGVVKPPEDPVDQADSEYPERGEGLARVNGEIRTSWIVDPPDGLVPFTAAARERLGLDRKESPSDNPEDLGGTTRCVSNAAAGAPMIGAADANVFQLVQTRDAVAIVTEKYHDVRIVRLAAGRAAQPPSWLGDSVGRWDGATLVIETTGVRPGEVLRGAHLYRSPTTRVVERFTRLAHDRLGYAFTVEDPALYTRPWRGEITLTAANGPMFEFACHEGNYSLPGILAGARLAEREAGAAKGR
jgi:hypothetical protein